MARRVKLHKKGATANVQKKGENVGGLEKKIGHMKEARAQRKFGRKVVLSAVSVQGRRTREEKRSSYKR